MKRLFVLGDALKLRIVDIFLFNTQYLCGICFLYLHYLRWVQVPSGWNWTNVLWKSYSMSTSPLYSRLDEVALGGGRATRAWWGQEVYKGGVHVLACCVRSPPLSKHMLFLPLTSHCCKDVVSSEPHHRPLRRTRSSFTSACPSLLRNQRFSRMSSWVQKMTWNASLCPPFLSTFLDFSF